MGIDPHKHRTLEQKLKYRAIRKNNTDSLDTFFNSKEDEYFKHKKKRIKKQIKAYRIKHRKFKIHCTSQGIQHVYLKKKRKRKNSFKAIRKSLRPMRYRNK